MTDRLRHLDRLFASRVLGLHPCTCNVPLTDDCGVDPDIRECSNCYGDRIGSYTRSLDAAWEGLTRFETNHEGAVLWRESGEYCAGIGDPDSIMFQSSSKANPAEALVLACLRACGVGEEDLA